MAEENVQVKFGASIDQLLRGLSTMTSQFTSSINGMKSQVASLQEVAGGIQRAFLAVTGVLAGGAIFAKAISETEKFIYSNVELARRLGTTAAEAGVLSIALGDVYVSTASFEGAVAILSRQLTTNEDKIRKLGVATRDSNGNFRNTVDILLDVNKKLLTFQEGTDRNIEGIKIYGRQWMQVQEVLKLTPQAIEAAREKMESLGLTITEQGVANTLAYKAAMNDVGDVLLALKNVIGQALMPILANLGNWFAETGPAMVSVFRIAINSVATLLWGLVFAAQVVYEVLKGIYEASVNTLSRLISVMDRIAHGDFFGAKAELSAIFEDDANKVGDIFDRIVERARKARDGIFALWDPNNTPAGAGKGGGGGESDGEEQKSRMKHWQSMWDIIKASQTNALADMSQAEAEFWQNILERETISVEERVALVVKLGALKATEQKRQYDAQVSKIQEELTLETTSLERKQAIAQKLQDLAVQTYGAESREARQAYMQVVQIYMQLAEQKRKLEAETHRQAVEGLSRRQTLERQNMDFEVQLGRLSEHEKLAAERSLIEEDYQTRRAALKEQLSWTGQLTRDEALRLQGELDALDDNHRAKVIQNQQDQVEERIRSWENLLAPVQNAISTSVQGLILGTTTWRDAFRNLGVSILASFVEMCTKIALKWAATQLGLTGATASGTASRMALETAAAAKSVALWAATAIKNIANSAWEAAAAAYKAIAGIPFVGPFLAPAMAIGAAMAVGGFAKNIVSAAGGYDVPRDMLAFVHKDEKILPADKSRAMDELLKNGGFRRRRRRWVSRRALPWRLRRSLLVECKPGQHGPRPPRRSSKLYTHTHMSNVIQLPVGDQRKWREFQTAIESYLVQFGLPADFREHVLESLRDVFLRSCPEKSFTFETPPGTREAVEAAVTALQAYVYDVTSRLFFEILLREVEIYKLKHWK